MQDAYDVGRGTNGEVCLFQRQRFISKLLPLPRPNIKMLACWLDRPPRVLVSRVYRVRLTSTPEKQRWVLPTLPGEPETAYDHRIDSGPEAGLQ